MQTLQNRNSQLKDSHHNEIYEGIFTSVQSKDGGLSSVKGGLDSRERIIFFFPFQTVISARDFRVADSLMIGDAHIRVINIQDSTSYCFSTLEILENFPGYFSIKNWTSVLQQIEFAERDLPFHRIGDIQLSSDCDPGPNRSPIIAENRILLVRKGKHL